MPLSVSQAGSVIAATPFAKLSIEPDMISNSFISSQHLKLQHLCSTRLRSLNCKPKGGNLMINRTECPTSCYSSRSAFCKIAAGGVFTLLSGKRRFVLDNWLCFAQLSEDARELKLAFSCCVVILLGQELQPILEDVMKNQLGEVREGG